MAVSKRSSATYNLVNMLFKSIFYSAQYSNLIGDNPTAKINAKGGVPKKEKEALTDAQAKLLLDTIRDLPPYVFVMIGLYSGLRREEILGLQNQLFFSTHSPRKKRGKTLISQGFQIMRLKPYDPKAVRRVPRFPKR